MLGSLQGGPGLVGGQAQGRGALAEGGKQGAAAWQHARGADRTLQPGQLNGQHDAAAPSMGRFQSRLQLGGWGQISAEVSCQLPKSPWLRLKPTRCAGPPEEPVTTLSRAHQLQNPAPGGSGMDATKLETRLGLMPRDSARPVHSGPRSALDGPAAAAPSGTAAAASAAPGPNRGGETHAKGAGSQDCGIRWSDIPCGTALRRRRQLCRRLFR